MSNPIYCASCQKEVAPKKVIRIKRYCSKVCQYAAFDPGISVGRPKGSKNLKPYPKTEAFWNKVRTNPPPSWSGRTHTYETREKMSQSANIRIDRIGPPHMSYKGKYTPQNIAKYKGRFGNIIYRSLWERRMFVWADNNPNVLEWNSEEIAIPYVSPKDGRVHRYFPDMFLKIKGSNGLIYDVLWEIKPEKETIQPKPKTREQVLMESKAMRRKYFLEVIKYGINKRKWEAAEQYCNERGWKFSLITEKQINALTGSKI